MSLLSGAGTLVTDLGTLASGVGDLAGGAAQAITGVGQVVNAIDNFGQGPQNQLVATTTGLVARPIANAMGNFDVPFVDVTPQGSANTLAALTSPFHQTMCGSRAQTHIQVSPQGKIAWFKPAGRPLVFSGDLQACKRVKKLAARARRAQRGGR